MIKYLKGLLGGASERTKNVMVVLSGTAMAQAIPVLGTLLLTRLYAPEDFGVFTVVLSLVAFSVAIAALKYDVAIVLPKSDSKSNHISNLAFFVGLGFCLTLLIVTLLLAGHIGNALGLKAEHHFWIRVLPLLTFTGIVYQILMNNATRYELFKVLSLGRVGRALVLTFSQIGLGLVSFAGGLLVGPPLGNVFGIFYLFKKLKQKLYVSKASDMKEVALEYKKFPKYTLLAATLNSFTNQVPVILMLKFFSEATAGHFGLTQRLLSLPVGIMANSVLDVFKQKASEQFNEIGNCREAYLWTLRKLLLMSVPIFGVLAIIAPWIFSFFFGQEWYESGVFARIMCILFIMRFVASPLSYVFFITGKQNYDLIWQLCLGVFTLLAFYIGYLYRDARLSVLFFSATYAFLYLINLFMTYRLSGTNHVAESRGDHRYIK